MTRDDAGAVVTGIGAVTAYGWGVEAMWTGLASGRSAIRETVHFDVDGHRTTLAAEVPKPPPPDRFRLAPPRGLSRADWFAVAAGQEAVAASGLRPPPEGHPEVGVFFGCSTAGMAETEVAYVLASASANRRPSLRDVATQPLNSPGDALARAVGATGPVETVSSACSSGGLAIGQALEALREGEVEVALAGGSDSLCHLTYSGFNALRAVDPRECRPFRADRAGLSLGEGAGVLVLERADAAAARGAVVLARIEGSGGSCDAHHMTAPHPEGDGAARAIEAALHDAHVDPAEIDFVHAHGTGTPLNDVAEWKAIRSIFGERAAALPMTSLKSAIGHLLGAAGAIEAVAVVECLRRGCLHPTFGDGAEDPQIAGHIVREAPFPLPPNARGISTNFAFGGANVALVVAGPPSR